MRGQDPARKRPPPGHPSQAAIPDRHLTLGAAEILSADRSPAGTLEVRIRLQIGLPEHRQMRPADRPACGRFVGQADGRALELCNSAP